jgi:NAD(P)-dependent dehydrogenase (short-subunit alcohol dehydrogenase family)
MIERGGGGAIVNISSAAGLKAFGTNVAYVAAKHGVIGLTRSMAVDLAEHNVRVNVICPGSVRDDPDLDSQMLKGVAVDWDVPLDQYEQVFAEYHLLPTLLEASDISRACVWLASDDGVRVTGSIVPVDAGLVTR